MKYIARVQCPCCHEEHELPVLRLRKLPQVKESYDDRKWREAVKKRDRYKCRRCPSRVNLEAHHIFGRGKPSTRTDLENGVTLCKDCHDEAHAHKEDFKQWVKSWMGEDNFEMLRIKSEAIVKRIAS